MKRTFTVNIANVVFHIDSDAYENLQTYLQKLGSYYGKEPDGEDIIKDIEGRIAELFTERSKGKDNVIDKKSVEEVIHILGTPEDIITSETGEEEAQSYSTGKRLYRDADNAVIAGVASGLAAYFGIDRMLMRILFVLAFFLSVGTIATFIYIIIWIFVPRALTTTQKMQMRGEPINVSNIEKFAKESYENIKNKF